MYVLLFKFIHLTQYIKLLQSTQMERKKTTGAIGELLIFFFSQTNHRIKRILRKLKKTQKCSTRYLILLFIVIKRKKYHHWYKLENKKL